MLIVWNLGLQRQDCWGDMLKKEKRIGVNVCSNILPMSFCAAERKMNPVAGNTQVQLQVLLFLTWTTLGK